MTSVLCQPGLQMCHTMWCCMVNLRVIQYVEGWEVALLSLSSLLTAFRLADPSVSPYTRTLQTPNWGRMDTCCPCLSCYHRGEREEGQPDQCWKHQHHIWIVLVYSKECHSTFRHGFLSQKWRGKGDASWVIESQPLELLICCWMTNGHGSLSPERGQTGAVSLFICNVNPKQRAPCHWDHSTLLWIIPQHCAHVITHSHTLRLTPPWAGRSYKSNK